MRLVRFLALLFLLTCPAVLCAADPFLGKWVMDTKRSKYVSGLPESMTIEMVEAGSGVHYHSETLLRTGVSFTADYTAIYDGPPAVVSGAKGILLPVAVRRLGRNRVVAEYLRGVERVATSVRTLSADGRTMTVTTTSKDGVGNSYTNTGVYRRVHTPSAQLLATVPLAKPKH